MACARALGFVGRQRGRAASFKGATWRAGRHDDDDDGFHMESRAAVERRENERRDVLVEPLTCISLILFPLGERGSGGGDRAAERTESIGTRLFTGRPSSHSQGPDPPPLAPRGSRSRSNCLRECLPEFGHNMNLVGRFIAVHFASVPSRKCSVLLCSVDTFFTPSLQQ